jgi:hypothetical protein
MSSSLSDSSINGPLRFWTFAGAGVAAGAFVVFDSASDCCVSLTGLSGESTLRRLTAVSLSLYRLSSAFEKSSLSPQKSGVSDRSLSLVTAVCSIFASPFLSSKKSPPAASFLELFPRCNVGVPRPLLGDRELAVANWVIRAWREVAPGGVSVFWKKLKMLELRFIEDCLVPEEPLDGVAPFFA